MVFTFKNSVGGSWGVNGSLPFMNNFNKGCYVFLFETYRVIIMQNIRSIYIFSFYWCTYIKHKQIIKDATEISIGPFTIEKA